MQLRRQSEVIRAIAVTCSLHVVYGMRSLIFATVFTNPGGRQPTFGAWTAVTAMARITLEHPLEPLDQREAGEDAATS